MNSDSREEHDKRQYFFDKPGRVSLFLRIFFAACVVLFLCDAFVPKTHLHFTWESSFGFYAVFGFVSCVVLVLIAKYALRPLVKRDEDYYD